MNKKAAICLRGAISKIGGCFTFLNELYNSNPYINFVSCYNSIQKHIVQANPDYTFDFFLQSWNQDLQDKLVSLYNPVKYLFENNNDYITEILGKSSNQYDFGGISQSLAIKKSLQLMEDSEESYDVVIVYRPDVILWKDMKLGNYDLSKIYVNGSENPDHVGDFHFVMNLENAKLFKFLYDSVNRGNPHRSHFWIKNYIINFMHKSVAMDDIIAGYDQEVLRKINGTAIKNNRLSLEKLMEYGLTAEEISQYNV